MPVSEIPFFMPGAISPEHGETAWQMIRQRLIDAGGFPPTLRRIHAVGYEHNSRYKTAVVGERDADVGQVVLAIFENETCFMVCTMSRGALGEEGPMLIGKPYWVEDFASASASTPAV